MIDDRDHVFRAEKFVGPGVPYLQRTLTGGRIESSAIPGFWIEVSWLWDDPLPNARRCLDEILTNNPPAAEI